MRNNNLTHLKANPLWWYTTYVVISANFEQFFKKKNVPKTTCRKFFAIYYEKQQSDSSLGQSAEEVCHCYILKLANFEQFYWVLSINNATVPYASCNFNVILSNNVLMHILSICRRNYKYNNYNQLKFTHLSIHLFCSAFLHNTITTCRATSLSNGKS